MTPPVLWYLSPLSLGTTVSYPVDCAVCSPRFSGEPSFKCPIPVAIMGVLLSNLCSRDLCPPTCPAGSLLPQFLHFVLLFSQAFLLPSRFVCLASTPQNLSKGNSLSKSAFVTVTWQNPKLREPSLPPLHASTMASGCLDR